MPSSARTFAVVVFLLASALVGDPAGAAAPRIVTVALPVPAGSTGTAEDINASGQVAGSVERDGAARPVRWDGSTRVDLPIGELPGGRAAEINDAGTVLGLVGSGPGTNNVARLWRADRSVEDCAAGYYFAGLLRLGERDQGRAGGGTVFVAERRHRPTIVRPGADPVYLPIPDGTAGHVYDFGPAGMVVGALGQSTLSSGSSGVWGSTLIPEQAVVWVGERMVRLGTLGGPTSAPLTTGRGVNRVGDVVGTSVTAAGQTHGFRWRLGRMTELGTLGGPSSTPVAVNDLGQIVGTSTTASGETHAFLWTGGRMIDLTPDATAGTATAINNRGQIAGSITTADGTRPVVWTVR